MTTIVVTGIGATSPLGGTARESWEALLAGESGARALEQPWVAEHDLPVTFAAQAKVRPEEVLERQEVKRLDPSAQFALIAAREAWADAGAPDIASERILVDYATGIGGLWLGVYALALGRKPLVPQNDPALAELRKHADPQDYHLSAGGA